MAKFTPRQLLFIAFIVGGSTTREAMIRAGYAEGSADVEGHRLLRNPKVASEVARRLRAMAEDLRLDQRDVILGLHRIATNPDAGDETRRKAWRDIGMFLGMGKFTMTVNQAAGTPAHERPELRALIRLLPPDKLRQFEEAMRSLADAEAELGRRKQIEHMPSTSAPS
jgi:hypothetical protein